jgi:hypothetical protein
MMRIIQSLTGSTASQKPVEKTQTLTRDLSNGKLQKIKIKGPVNFNEFEDPDLEMQKETVMTNSKNAMIDCITRHPDFFTPQYSEEGEIIGCISIDSETGKPIFIKV